MLSNVFICLSVLIVVSAQIFFGDDEPLLVKKFITTTSKRTTAGTTKPTASVASAELSTVNKKLEPELGVQGGIVFGEEFTGQASGSIVTSQPIPPKCEQNETYVESMHSCVGILTQGSCPNNTWVVVNEQTMSPECVSRPADCAVTRSEKSGRCAEAALTLREKLNPNVPKLSCESSKNLTLAFTASGEVVCICKKGFVYWEPEEQCYEAFQRGPCNHGEYISHGKMTKPQTSTTETTVAASPTTEEQITERTTEQILTNRNQRARVALTTTIPSSVPTTVLRKTSKRTTAASAESLATATMDERSRNMDEIDNTDLSFMRMLNINTNSSVQNTSLIDKTIDDMKALDDENRENDDDSDFESKCVINSCPEGFIPIDLDLLAKSPASNIPSRAPDVIVEDVVIFGEDMAPATTQPPAYKVVCDSLHSQKYCKTDYVLEINPETLEPDCIGLDSRSSFDSVPFVACSSGYKIDGAGNCVKRVRFG